MQFKLEASFGRAYPLALGHGQRINDVSKRSHYFISYYEEELSYFFLQLQIQIGRNMDRVQNTELGLGLLRRLKP
jgi:hypothetical protein